MTLQASKLFQQARSHQLAYTTQLDASHAAPQEAKGVVRFTYDPAFGYRGFQYVRFDQSGGADKGQIVTYRPIVALTATGGTTTSITTTTTADILVGGLLRCLDDAGGAGAAPEGEIGLITSNTATKVYIDSNDAFSAAPANNDTFQVILPWAVVDAASGDTAAQVAGVVMANQDQYDWGWVQFAGLHPAVNAIAAGTAITIKKGVIASTNVVTNGSSSVPSLILGYTETGITSDTVLRTLPVYLSCGQAFRLGVSA